MIRPLTDAELAKLDTLTDAQMVVSPAEYRAIRERLRLAEAVVNAVRDFHTSQYASTAWEVRQRTRRALAEYREAINPSSGTSHE